MFNALRLRLTMLYFGASLLLLATLGVGAYLALDHYFRSSTDIALQRKLVGELQVLGIELPSEWQQYAQPTRVARPSYNDDDDDDEQKSRSSSGYTGRYDDDGHERPAPVVVQESGFDPALAPIYVSLLTDRAELVRGQSQIAPQREAVAQALLDGQDLRTVVRDDGVRVRLLTYRLPVRAGGTMLQLGRELTDQDHALQETLVELVGLGVLLSMVIGLGSWWLAGRAIVPAQQAYERQQAFIANASHELRTPLTLIRASAEVAQRGVARDDETHELLGDVLSETDHMSQLVDDLLTLARLDAGRLNIDPQPIEIEVLLGDVARQVGRVAEQRRVAVEVTQARGVVLADPLRLRQILLILLDNALRYTTEGGRVTLEGVVEDGAEGSGRRSAVGPMMRVVVADTGMGMSAEQLPHVFERFYRGDAVRSAGDGSNRPGAGLGLAIAKALVEAQGGSIMMSSQLGVGTSVRFWLPMATRNML